MTNVDTRRIAVKRPGKLAAFAILGLFAAALTVSLPSAARADDGHGHGHGHDHGHRYGHEMHGRDWHDGDWHEHEEYAHRYWGYPEYVAAPPVVYAPPPIMESPGLNLIIPLHIH